VTQRQRTTVLAILSALVGPAKGFASEILRIDHTSICGSALAPLESAFAEAGLPTEYGGPHATGGTHMAIVGFEDGSYLELIAPQEPRASIRQSPWGKAMAGDAGPCAWAVATPDIAREVGRIAALRIATTAPEPGSRTKPDGTVIRWKTAGIGKGPRGAKMPFLIEDVTPRRLRADPSLGAPNTGLTGVRIVVVGVKRLESSAAQFRKAWRWGKPESVRDPDFGARLAYFPGEPVILAEPLQKKGSNVAFRLQRFGEGPVAVLLGTSDLDAAKKRFGLVDESAWFGRKVAWFPPTSLRGMRIGVISP
jgi:hypothetical protein